MKVLESIVVAFSMYSKIPMPHIEWNKENMKNVLCFFPWVGAVAGVLVWLWFRVSDQFGFGVMLRASVAVLIPVLVTGGIHLDGLLDTADALSSWQTRERRLEILKDSHAGAFAIIVWLFPGGFRNLDGGRGGRYRGPGSGIYSEPCPERIWYLHVSLCKKQRTGGYFCTGSRPETVSDRIGD